MINFTSPKSAGLTAFKDLALASANLVNCIVNFLTDSSAAINLAGTIFNLAVIFCIAIPASSTLSVTDEDTVAPNPADCLINVFNTLPN